MVGLFCRKHVALVASDSNELQTVPEIPCDNDATRGAVNPLLQGFPYPPFVRLIHRPAQS